MITAGVDVGAKTVKIVLVQDGRIIGRSLIPAGYDFQEIQQRAWTEALAEAGLDWNRIDRVMATGAGRKELEGADGRVTEVSAAARGALALDGRVRTIIDVGAEEGRAIHLDGSGRVLDFAVNEKCAAGTGAFIEAMARALEVKIEDLGPLSRQSTRAVVMNAQCVVFAESELVTLVHSQTPKPDIARAVHDAIADRIAALVRRVGLEKEVLCIGGVARNLGLLESLQRELQTPIILPEAPEIVSAYGAALLAAEQ